MNSHIHLAVLFAAVVFVGPARANERIWLGGNDEIKSIEFRDKGDGIFEEYHNGLLKFRYHEEPTNVTVQWGKVAIPGRVADVQLYDASSQIRVRLKPDWAEVLTQTSSKYSRFCRGGWKGKFKKVGPVSTRYHGNYAGGGNRGGRPKDALDRAAQRHDIGYARRGPFDIATDARFTVDSIGAAVNPFNDMAAAGRVKALAAGSVITAKQGVNLPVNAVKTAPGLVKGGFKVVKSLF